jgi:hypothetical protein
LAVIGDPQGKTVHPPDPSAKKGKKKDEAEAAAPEAAAPEAETAEAAEPEAAAPKAETAEAAEPEAEEEKQGEES